MQFWGHLNNFHHSGLYDTEFQTEVKTVEKILLKLHRQVYRCEEALKAIQNETARRKEPYLMGLEDLAGIKMAAADRIGHIESDKNTKWKRKVLHATQIQRRDLESKLNSKFT